MNENFVKKEKEFLENLYENYITSDDSPYLKNMRRLEVKRISPYLNDNMVGLEMGCEIGYMTSLLAPLMRWLDVIEGSESFAEATRKRQLPNVTITTCLFEEYQPPKSSYDCIFMSHVLEHLENPHEVLLKVKDWLKPDGYLFVVVPNGNALSRRLAQAMKLFDDRFKLTPNDVRGGHRRIYDRISLIDQLRRAGFCCTIEGLLMKPLADFQMDQLLTSNFLTQDHLDGLAEVGRAYPDLCGAILAVARKENCS